MNRLNNMLWSSKNGFAYLTNVNNDDGYDSERDTDYNDHQNDPQLFEMKVILIADRINHALIRSACMPGTRLPVCDMHQVIGKFAA